jgi:hypothetical protein
MVGLTFQKCWQFSYNGNSVVVFWNAVVGPG